MTMRRALLGLIVLTALALPALADDDALIQPGDRLEARILKVTDGDTIVAEVRGLLVTVRLAGVDCPERNAKGGAAATDFTKQWIGAGPDVTLEAYQDFYTKRPDCWDRYGRLLAWVWRDGHLLQEDLIRTGHAEIKYIKEKDKHYARLQAAKE